MIVKFTRCKDCGGYHKVEVVDAIKEDPNAIYIALPYECVCTPPVQVQPEPNGVTHEIPVWQQTCLRCGSLFIPVGDKHEGRCPKCWNEIHTEGEMFYN